MNPKVKKTISFIAIIIVVLFATLLILPFAFKGQIIKVVKNQANEMLDAKLDFEDFGLSFFRDFPNASLKLKNVCVTGVDVFENDTLLAAEDIFVSINLKSLFSSDGYQINKVEFKYPKLTAHILADGKANWDIMKESDVDEPEEEASTEPLEFNLQLKEFNIVDADIVYWDEEGGMKAEIFGLNHRTSGDLSADNSLLKTNTSIRQLNFAMDGIEYLSKSEVELKADINANLNDMVFAFSENSSRINAIKFAFDGWVQVLDDGLDMDLKLNTKELTFKSILSMVPAIYSTSFDGLKADGNVGLDAWLKGKMVGEDYPAFEFKLDVANAWFQYPDLPKSLQDINVKANISSKGGDLDNTIVDVSRFSFNMGGNPFAAQAHLAYPMSDPAVKLQANGKIDLGMVKDIYPLEDGMELNGVFDMNLNVAGRMSYYEKNQFDKFIFGGKMSIADLLLKGALAQDISVPQTSMTFNNQFVDLKTQVNIGKNDIAVSGEVENFMGFLFSDQTLSGELNVSSKYFNLNDFMSSTETEESQTEESESIGIIEIPKNIHFTAKADFKEILYEKMHFANAKGVLTLADGVVQFQKLGMNAFGGSVVVVNGQYSVPQPESPKVNLDLNIGNIEFTQIVEQVEMMEKLVPIFKKATGKFSTTLILDMDFDKNMDPDLNSLNAKGTFSTQSVGLSEVPALDALANALKRSDLSNSQLKNLKITYEIKDGRLETEPFDFNINKVNVNMSGTSGLDQTLDYTGKVRLPDNLNLGKLSNFDLKIGGTFTSPKVSVDVKGAVTAVVDDAKEKIQAEVDAAKEKISEEISKQKEAAIKAAEQQAEKLKTEAQKAGEKLVAEAEKQGQALVDKANNALTKKAAQVSADELVKKAKEKADDLNKEAEKQGQALVDKAKKALE